MSEAEAGLRIARVYSLAYVFATLERLITAMNLNPGFELVKSTTLPLASCGGTIMLSSGPTYVPACNELHDCTLHSPILIVGATHEAGSQAV
jgi:hypothetical protein